MRIFCSWTSAHHAGQSSGAFQKSAVEELTAMIRTALILSVVAISISGCADVIVDDPYLVGTKFSYTRPHTAHKQADSDWAKCKKENMSDPDRGLNAPEKRLAEQCMKVKGYTVTESTSDGVKVAQPAN
jgi:hypothetical protein